MRQFPLVRSALYLPAANARAMEKARSLGADALIFDLEDAVAPGQKEAARSLLGDALSAGGYGERLRLVRVNGAQTPWGAADLAALAGLAAAGHAPDGVVLPKVAGPEDIARARAVCGDLPVWAMLETPAGIANAPAIATAPGLAGLIMGTNDLARELGARWRPDRLPLQFALQAGLMAARGAGVLCLDGVFNALADAEGLAAECRQGRDLGFDGKTVIHPAQIAAANAAFSPLAAEIDLARRQIAAWQEAVAMGRGVAVVDGRIVENLHIVTAQATLAHAAAIARRDG